MINPTFNIAITSPNQSFLGGQAPEVDSDANVLNANVLNNTQGGGTLPESGEKTDQPTANTPAESAGTTLETLDKEQQQQVVELVARDREVRSHEAAHANVGGRFAGSPSFTFQRGPDGKSYAVAGEVPIDVAPVPNDPQATIEKARIVRRAALAPANPSAQDRAVAAEALALETEARAELLANRVQQGNTDQSSVENDSSFDADNNKDGEARASTVFVSLLNAIEASANADSNELESVIDLLV